MQAISLPYRSNIFYLPCNSVISQCCILFKSIKCNSFHYGQSFNVRPKIWYFSGGVRNFLWGNFSSRKVHRESISTHTWHNINFKHVFENAELQNCRKCQMCNMLNCSDIRRSICAAAKPAPVINVSADQYATSWLANLSKYKRCKNCSDIRSIYVEAKPAPIIKVSAAQYAVSWLIFGLMGVRSDLNMLLMLNSIFRVCAHSIF